MRKNEQLEYNIAQKIFIPIDMHTAIHRGVPNSTSGLCYRDDIYPFMIGGVLLHNGIAQAVNGALRENPNGTTESQ